MEARSLHVKAILVLGKPDAVGQLTVASKGQSRTRDGTERKCS
jgi:hypothetical protein